MKRILLRTFLAVSILDVVLGLAFLACALVGVADRYVMLRGVGFTLVFGCWGVAWSLRTLAATRQEVRT